MSAEIVDLSEQQSHLVIPCPEHAHVVPVSLMREWIAGRGDAPLCIVMVVLGEWLKWMQS